MNPSNHRLPAPYLDSRTGKIFGTDQSGEPVQFTVETLKNLPGLGPSRLEFSQDGRLCVVYVRNGLQLPVSLLEKPETKIYVWNYDNGHDIRVLWRDQSKNIVIVRVTGEGKPLGLKRMSSTEDNQTLADLVDDLPDTGTTQVTLALPVEGLSESGIELNDNLIIPTADAGVTIARSVHGRSL